MEPLKDQPMTCGCRLKNRRKLQTPIVQVHSIRSYRSDGREMDKMSRDGPGLIPMLKERFL